MSTCGKSHKGRLRYFVEPLRKRAFAGCSWCGRPVGRRTKTEGAALWNLFRDGFKDALSKQSRLILTLPDEAVVPLLRRLRRRS